MTVGRVDRSTTGVERGQHHRATNRAEAEDADPRAGSERGLADGVDRDGERFRDGRFGEAEAIVDLEAILLGHHEVFREAAVRLARATEKAIRTTSVLAAGEALVALAAGHRRFDGNAVARPNVRDTAADFDHRAGALVADRERILDDLTADAASRVIVNVGPADADGTHPDEHVGRLVNLRIGHHAHCHRTQAGEREGFHGGATIEG